MHECVFTFILVIYPRAVFSVIYEGIRQNQSQEYVKIQRRNKSMTINAVALRLDG